ncbi:hypothetical protein I4U23_014442 [Adineta vaga]|nr:hypothetical protein I4U23_014442 [Adineta vaga]
MLFLRKHRSFGIYLFLIPIILFISVYLTYYDHKLPKIFINTIQQNSSRQIVSTDYLNVRLNLTSNAAICHSNDILIIYILSTAHNFDRRNVIRSTWGSPFLGTCFVFILGKSQSPIQQRIEQEKRKYKDIVQIDHVESYGNVVYKEVGALHWSSHFYPSIPFLFKTDDDLIVDTLLISSIAQILTSNNKNNSSYISKHRPILITDLLSKDRSTLFCGGWSMMFQPTLRSGKFGVSEYVWPHPTLPLYCSGFGWFMSKDVRNRLVETSYTYPVNKTAWVGDVFVSGFLAKEAKVKCTGIAIEYEQLLSGKCACLMTKHPMLTVCSSLIHVTGGGHEATVFREYEMAWKVIQERHNSTNRTNFTDMNVC